MYSNVEEGRKHLMVTITYGHGYLDDCAVAAAWTKSQSNINPGDATLTCLYGDVLDISGVFDDNLDEYVVSQIDFTNISSDVYPYYMVRWKTQDSASPGAGANIKLYYTVGNQFLLNAAAVPQFSDTWKVTTGTLDAGKTLDYLWFMLDDYPDSFGQGASETRHCYFDFCLFHKDTFTLPNVAHGMRWNPGTRDVYLGVPGRITDITQRMGAESATCTLGCDLDQGPWTATGYANYPGEIFDYIAHRSYTEPWQWVTGLKERSMKATIHPTFNYDGGRSRLDLELREYSLGDKSVETHAERWNIT